MCMGLSHHIGSQRAREELNKFVEQKCNVAQKPSEIKTQGKLSIPVPGYDGEWTGVRNRT